MDRLRNVIKIEDHQYNTIFHLFSYKWQDSVSAVQPAPASEIKKEFSESIIDQNIMCRDSCDGSNTVL